MSPLRRGVWVLCVRAWIACVSENHAWHMSFVFYYWMEKRRCSGSLVVSFFELPLTAMLFQFRWCKSISPNWLGRTIMEKAFVRLRLLMFWYPIPLPTKTNDPIAVSANPTKEKAKPHVAAGTNSLSPNNEKRAIPAQQPD